MGALGINELAGQGERPHWSRQQLVKRIIAAVVEAKEGGGIAVPAGKAADSILAYLAPALEGDDYLWKWVERGLFCPQTPSKTALECLAYHPSAPWHDNRWDVDHKPYAERFYAAFPNARTPTPEAEIARLGGGE
jgi:hypothetical protein